MNRIRGFTVRALILIPVIVSLAACEPLPPPGPVAMTPFTWKANTPRITRGFDINECELAARGLPPNATADQIAAASSRANLEQEARFVRSCLSNKGYTVTQIPVCTDRDRARGTVVFSPDVLPPLEDIRCADPAARSLIVG